MSSFDTVRRKSSTSKLDKEKLARLQQLKMFQQSGNIASKLLKMKVTAEESAAAAISLSKVMARKKGGEVSLQVEIETEAQWKLLLRRDGLIVVEVYSGWCGPCLSMVSFLKKVKVNANDDRLTLATVNSDNIDDLRIFRGQSEPTWIFMGGGKPVRLIRGANSPSLMADIKSAFEYELLCMEGKAKRNLISLKDEAERRHKAKAEAIHLAAAQKEAEAELMVDVVEPTPTPKQLSVSPPPPNASNEDFIGTEIPSLESVEVAQNLYQPTQPTLQPIPRDALADVIHQQLMSTLEAYAVLAIQGFLLETGAVTEIKDHLSKDFRIIKERYIFLDDSGVRRLFGIPYHLYELIEEEELEDDGDPQNDDNCSELKEDGDAASIKTDVPGDKTDSEAGGESATEMNDTDEGMEEVKEKIPQYRKIPLPLPNELVGDTLLFLLESVEVVKQKEDQNVTLGKTADDYLRFRVGPSSYKVAAESEPKSLLGLYGREEYAVGTWCPRNQEDKKYVMLHFFPQLVTEMLMPPPKEMPKYMVAIFPALFSNEIMEHPELVTNVKDVIAQGKTTLSSKLVDRILKSRGHCGDDLDAQKKALTGFDMFAVCIDERNESLAATLVSLEPIHYSVNNDNGRFETAKLFPHLNILIDNDFDDDLYRRDLIVEKFLARPKFKLDVIFGDDDGHEV